MTKIEEVARAVLAQCMTTSSPADDNYLWGQFVRCEYCGTRAYREPDERCPSCEAPR